MRSSIYNNRYLKVETTATIQKPSPASKAQHAMRSPISNTVKKSPNHTTISSSPTTPSFMKSTASSIMKVTSPRLFSPLSPYHNNSDDLHLDATEKLIQDLIRFTRSSDRRMLIRTLKDCTLLQNIPVDDHVFNSTDYPSSNDAWNEIKDDIVNHLPIEINGIVMGASFSNDREKHQEGEKLMSILPLLCNKLVHGISNSDTSQQHKSISSDELYHLLLLRLSNKRNSAITFAQVNKVLDCKDLSLQIPKRPVKPLQRSNVVIYNADSAIHVIMEHHYAIGLFRKSDSAGRPWIGLTATLRERINLSNNQAVRYIALQIHEEKPVVY